MRVHEIITESKTVAASKPRNFVAKNAKMGGAGQHKDKKKAATQGDTKHKNKQYAESVTEGYDPVESDYSEWEQILHPHGAGDNALELMLGQRIESDGPDTIRNILAYVKQHREVLGKEVSDESGRTVKDAIIDIRNAYPRLYQAAKQPQGVKEGRVDEKAVSKAQQKFMGMVYAAKKGEKPASPEVAKVAKGMSKKAAKDYASTKHKGKPDHVKEDGDGGSGGATAGSTTSAMVGVGAVYKNKRAKMQKPGTNALDMKGGNLFTGGSIAKR